MALLAGGAAHNEKKKKGNSPPKEKGRLTNETKNDISMPLLTDNPLGKILYNCIVDYWYSCPLAENRTLNSCGLNEVIA